MYTAIHNCLSSNPLVFATDAELYKNVTNMIYSYNTLLQQIFTLITTAKYHLSDSLCVLLPLLLCNFLTINFSSSSYTDTALFFTYIL